MPRALLTIVLAGAAFAAGCRRGDPPEHTQVGGTDPSAPVAQSPTTGGGGGGDPAAATAKAKEIFATRCTPCHGPNGGGDGPASASLNPKPRNFQDATWQASVTDEHIETIIKMGGAAVGKSPAMPSNPDLMDDTATVAALRGVVRSLKH